MTGRDGSITLVTARAARGTDPDMPLLLAALRGAGADAREVDWDDRMVDWSGFDLAVLRSTWDYVARLPEFLDWAERVSRVTRLVNPVEVVRWNTDKHYLADLARAGVPVVPGRFVEPGEDAARAVDDFLSQDGASVPAGSTRGGKGRRGAPSGQPAPSGSPPGDGDVVVKPAVGAGSRDAQRHARDHRDAIVAHVRRLTDAGRSVLLQPYLASVDQRGEIALLFFDGAFSHAARKGPMLTRGAASTTALYAPETITPASPSHGELAIARRALKAIPFAKPLLYARVDLIRDDDGSPVVLELELVEPSVFAGYADGAAERFARAILQRV